MNTLGYVFSSTPSASMILRRPRLARNLTRLPTQESRSRLIRSRAFSFAANTITLSAQYRCHFTTDWTTCQEANGHYNNPANAVSSVIGKKLPAYKRGPGRRMPLSARAYSPPLPGGKPPRGSRSLGVLVRHLGRAVGIGLDAGAEAAAHDHAHHFLDQVAGGPLFPDVQVNLHVQFRVAVGRQAAAQFAGQTEPAGRLVDDVLPQPVRHRFHLAGPVVAGALPPPVDVNRGDETRLIALVRVGPDDDAVRLIGIVLDVGDDVVEHLIKGHTALAGAVEHAHVIMITQHGNRPPRTRYSGSDRLRR